MKKILLTGSAVTVSEEAAFFKVRGYDPVSLPLTELRLLPLSEAAVASLQHSDWVFFTSKAPVAEVLAQTWPETKIAAVGMATAEAVRRCGFKVDFVSQGETKKALLAEWREAYPESQARIFYPRSNLAEPFHIVGQIVESFVCYENYYPEGAKTQLERLFVEKSLQAAYLSSPSAWERFRETYQSFPQDLELIAKGTTTQRAMIECGFVARLKQDL